MVAEYRGPERRVQSDEGRRQYDAKPAWPTYIALILSLAAVVWSAAVNVANAAATGKNVDQMQTQLNQMQSTAMQLRSAVDVLNCKVGITCRIDGH